MAASVLASAPTSAPSLVETILAEGPLTMSSLARKVVSSRLGKGCHPSTPTRWHTHGVRLPDGRTVRLEAVKIAGKLVSSYPRLVAFIAAQQTEPTSDDTPAPRSPSARKRASDAAGAKLAVGGC
jgi:hypothetical protein